MDPTENIRRKMVYDINSQVRSDNKDKERERLESIYGPGNVWDTRELSARFEVLGFMAPFCVVQDRKTGEKGSVEFIHNPRLYFNYKKD